MSSDVGSSSDTVAELTTVTTPVSHAANNNNSSSSNNGNNNGSSNNYNGNNYNNNKIVEALRRQVNKLQSRVDALERQLAAVVACNANMAATLNTVLSGGAGGAQAGLGLPFAMRGVPPPPLQVRSPSAAGPPPPPPPPPTTTTATNTQASAGFPFGAASPTQPPGISAMPTGYMTSLSGNVLALPPHAQSQQPLTLTSTPTTTPSSNHSGGVTPSLLHMGNNNNSNNNNSGTAAAAAATGSHTLTPTKMDDAAGAALSKQLEGDMARLGMHMGNGDGNAQPSQPRDDAILAMLSGQPTPNMTPTSYSPIFPNTSTMLQPHGGDAATATTAATAAAAGSGASGGGGGLRSMQGTPAMAGVGGNAVGHVDVAAMKANGPALSPFAALQLSGRPQQSPPQPQLQQQGMTAGMMLSHHHHHQQQQQQQQQQFAAMMSMAGMYGGGGAYMMHGGGGGGGMHAAAMPGGALLGLDPAHAAAMMGGGGGGAGNRMSVGGVAPAMGLPPALQPFFGVHSPVTATSGGMMMPGAAAPAAVGGGGGGGVGGFMLNHGANNNNGNINNNSNNNNNNSGGGGGGNATLPMGGQAPLPTAITLDPTRANNEALDRVCQQQPWLKEVCLKGCKNITNFTPLARLRNLWKLNLQGCAQYVDDAVVAMIGMHNRRLSRLNLCGCERITDATPLSHLSFLFDLNLSGCPIGNASLEAIARNCLQLSRLAINSCPQLTDVRCLTSLKELKLLYCRYSDKIDPESICVVLNAIGSSLLTLNVDGIHFAQLDLTQLPPVMALKNLNIKDNAAVTDLFWLTGLPGVDKTFASLEMLDAEGCTALSQLGSIAALPSLKTLRLSHTAITQAELTQLASCPALTTLYVDHCANLTNVECLASVSTLTKVYVDQRFAHGSGGGGYGIAALQQTRHIDIVYAVPSASSSGGNNNNNNNSSSSGSSAPSGASGYANTASLYASGILGAFSPTASPTAAFVPALPSVGAIGSGSGGGSGAVGSGSNNVSYALSPGATVSASGDGDGDGGSHETDAVVVHPTTA